MILLIILVDLIRVLLSALGRPWLLWQIGLCLVLLSGCVATPRPKGAMYWRVQNPAPSSPWVVWMDANGPDRLPEVLPQVAAWLPVVDAVVLTAGHAQLPAVCAQAAAQLHGVQIIPGVITADALGRDIGNAAGWAQIGPRVREACMAVGSTECILDDEYVLSGYWSGQEFDEAGLRAGLRLLPQQITFYIWPGVVASSPERSERLARICAEELAGHVSIIGTGWGHPAIDAAIQARSDALGSVTSGIIWFANPQWSGAFWPAESFPTIYRTAKAQRLFLYPGTVPGVATGARAMRALLSDSDSARWRAAITEGRVFARGDCNWDGVVNFNDLNPFVRELSAPGASRREFCPADLNADGRVDAADINPFVSLLTQTR